MDKKTYYEQKLKALDNDTEKQEYILEILFLLNRIDGMKRCENCLYNEYDQYDNIWKCPRYYKICNEYSEWEYEGGN